MLSEMLGFPAAFSSPVGLSSRARAMSLLWFSFLGDLDITGLEEPEVVFGLSPRIPPGFQHFLLSL
jgi:hypothetical protein